NRVHFILNESISSNQQYLAAIQCIRLCSLEITLIEQQLSYSPSNGGLASYFDWGSRSPFSNVAHFPLNDSSLPFTLNNLHALVWNLFQLYDMLTEFVQNTQKANANPKIASNHANSREKLLFKINE